MTNKKLIQFRLNYIPKNKSLLPTDPFQNNSFPDTFEGWTDGTMGNTIGIDKQIYSLQVYGMPGTQFYLNNGLTPVELGPSGYYGVELNDFAGISKLMFDQTNLTALYSDAIDSAGFIPLVIDAKIKTVDSNYVPAADDYLYDAENEVYIQLKNGQSITEAMKYLI